MRGTRWLAERRRGLALVETVCATLILALALASAAELFRLAIRLSPGVEERSTGLFLAQAKMEEMLSKPFDEVASQAPAPIEGHEGFTAQVTVSDFERSLEKPSEAKMIVVVVRWDEGKETAELATLVTRVIPK